MAVAAVWWHGEISLAGLWSEGCVMCAGLGFMGFRGLRVFGVHVFQGLGGFCPWGCILGFRVGGS